MLRHRYLIGRHSGCGNSFSPFRSWIVRYVPYIVQMPFDDILVVMKLSLSVHILMCYVIRSVLIKFCSSSPFRDCLYSVGAGRSGESRSRKGRTCQVRAFRQLLYNLLNPSSLVVNVRRFTNSRNKVGILSSHRQTMLSILTSISLSF